MSPALGMILAFVVNWCAKKDCKVYVTSIYRSEEYNEYIGAVSYTHCEGRAMDISSISAFGWNQNKKRELIAVVEKEFAHIGAFNHNGESRPIVLHGKNKAEHFHIQVRRDL